MKLPRDLFDWLGIPARFGLDMAELDRKQRELYAERQADGPRSLELLNEVVRLLRDPAVRAEEIFRRRCWRIKGSPDPILLERIFTDREFIDQARKKGDLVALEAWLEAAKPRLQTLLAELTQLLDQTPRAGTQSNDDWAAATHVGADAAVPTSGGRPMASREEPMTSGGPRSSRQLPSGPQRSSRSVSTDVETEDRAASDPDAAAENARVAERALLLLEELRYLSRALAAARAAIAALEE